MAIRLEVAAHRVVWPFYAARLSECRQPSRQRRGPLQMFVAPLEAGERVPMGAAAAFSAGPPTLLESVAYLLSVPAVLSRRAAS